jgi:nanoRNase/pAp phosphatase (c-di-AMP/oligoRNAs hydrolase)
MHPIESMTASNHQTQQSPTQNEDPSESASKLNPEIQKNQSNSLNPPDVAPDLHCYTPEDSLSEEEPLLGPEDLSPPIPQTIVPNAVPYNPNYHASFIPNNTPQSIHQNTHTNNIQNNHPNLHLNQNNFNAPRKNIQTFPPVNLNISSHTQAPMHHNNHTQHNGLHHNNHNYNNTYKNNNNGNHLNFSMIANAEELGDGYFQDYSPYYEDDYKEKELISKSNPKYNLLSKKYQKRLDDFYHTMEEARGSKVLIVLKGHPDPDSIACAFAQQYINDYFEIKTTIIYFDEISHPENQALVKGIEIKMSCYHNLEHFSIEDFDYLSFVDTPSTDLPSYIESTLPVLTVVDHHKVDHENMAKAKFVDIRDEYGATSSIYAEYLELITPLSLTNSRNSDATLATALMHGIRTDTDNLMLGSTVDFHAAGYLKQFLDKDLLRTVSKQSVTAHTMEIIKQGLMNKVIKSTILIAGVGFVREEDRDGIGQTADFLLRHEGVETAIVFGIVNGDSVDGSLRTSSAKIDPDRWIKEVFGQDSAGKHYGGGRRNKGGFRIPLGLLAKCTDRKALWRLGEQTILELIHNKIGEKFNGMDDDEDSSD